MPHDFAHCPTWTFSKMHGLGNDFIVIDGVRQAVMLTPDIVRRLADRHFGIGADQILLVDHPLHPEAHFRYRIFNADGTEVEHCGNGARCFVRFVHEQGLSKRNPLIAETARGLIRLTLHDDQQVTVDMGAPVLGAKAVQFTPTNGETVKAPTDLHTIDTPEGALQFAFVSMGNPHAVCKVDQPTFQQANLAVTGDFVAKHASFAQGVNVGFAWPASPQQLHLRVVERGVGETLACGTGACAAVVTGVTQGWLQSPVTVHTRAGSLHIEYDGQRVYMRGPTNHIFTGQLHMPTFMAEWPLP